MAEYAQTIAPRRDTTETSTRASFGPDRSFTRDRLQEKPGPDTRPDTLQAALNRSPRAQDLMQLQRTINQSPRVQALAQLRTTVARSPGPVAQLAEPARTANQTGLPDRLKAGLETLSGLSMDDVHVHYNSSKPAELNALAYAQGRDIHVAPGQQSHLPHEAWHVVQQAQGRVHPTMQLKDGVPANDDEGMEREADVMGPRAEDAGRAAPALVSQTRGAIHAEKAGALEPARAGSAPVQRQLNRQAFIGYTKPSSGINQDFRNALLRAIDSYNKTEKRKDRSDKNTHKNLAALDDIEHRIYTWFDENKTGASWESRHAMFNLMNEIQENHKYWIAVAVEEGHDMWTHDEVEDDEKELINQLWSHIVDGTGAFEFKTKVHTAEGFKDLPGSVLEKFKTEIYAMLARLYSRPKGRELLKALDRGAADDKTIAFVMSPIYKILGHNRYFTTPYVGAKATAYDDSAARVRLKGQGLSKKNRTVVAGKGSGSGVEIAPGIKDASMMDFDAAGDQILSPAFIGVGHELIHAAHYSAGTYIGQKPHKSPHARVPGEYGDDVEEFLTIASPQERQKAKNVAVTSTLERLFGGTQPHTFKMSQWDKLNGGLPTEAEIRAEHGLSIRHGHTTTANPNLYRGAKKGTDPGDYVADAINWITPHLDQISPPQPNVVAVGGQQRQGGQMVVDSKLSAFLKTLRVRTVVGSVIGLAFLVGLYLKYGNPFTGEEP